MKITRTALAYGITSLLFSTMSMTSAQALTVDPVLSKCAPSPFMHADILRPTTVGLGNNLRRPAGSPLSATGTPIIIQGRLLDKNCVPLSDAVVELWQNDAGGTAPYALEKIKKKGTAARTTPLFAGSGTTLTNNLGQFSFITVMPAMQEKTSPAVHIRIKYGSLDPFETDLILTKEHKLDEKSLHQPLYFFDVTLRTQNKYRRF